MFKKIYICSCFMPHFTLKAISLFLELFSLCSNFMFKKSMRCSDVSQIPEKELKIAAWPWNILKQSDGMWQKAHSQNFVDASYISMWSGASMSSDLPTWHRLLFTECDYVKSVNNCFVYGMWREEISDRNIVVVNSCRRLKSNVCSIALKCNFMLITMNRLKKKESRKIHCVSPCMKPWIPLWTRR